MNPYYKEAWFEDETERVYRGSYKVASVRSRHGWEFELTIIGGKRLGRCQSLDCARMIAAGDLATREAKHEEVSETLYLEGMDSDDETRRMEIDNSDEWRTAIARARAEIRRAEDEGRIHWTLRSNNRS